MWDLVSRTCVAVLQKHTESVTCACLLPGLDHPAVLSGSLDSNLYVWDMRQGIPVFALEGHTQPVVSVAFIGGGRAASGSCLGTLRIWNVATGGCVRRLKGHMARPRGPAAPPPRSTQRASHAGSIPPTRRAGGFGRRDR